MAYNSHAGHNEIVQGASSILNEVKEDRKVNSVFINYMKAAGHTVYDCTDDKGKTQQANLENIVKKCNAHNVTYDISWHLNSGGGNGVEVLIYDNRTKDIAEKVAAAISEALGIPNRGVKLRPELYVLRNTKALAMIIECCFVDSTEDADKWNADKCAKAVAEVLNGKAISESKPSENTPHKTAATPEVKGRGYAAGMWWDIVSSFTTSGTEAYIGVKGEPLRALQIWTVGDADVVGKLKYRFRKLGGGYYNYQIDREMDKNGENFAGDKVSKFDRLQISLEGLSGYEAEYRVYDSKHGWLPWVRGFNNSNSSGYAGWDGYAIECVQVRIVKVA